MAEGIRNMVISFILVGLFSLALISFIYQATIDNNPSSKLLTTPELNTTFYNLNKTLSGYQDTAESQKNKTFDENVNPLVATFELAIYAIVGVARIFSNMIVNVWDILTGFMFNVIGIPAIVIGVIFAIITITIVFYLFKMWRVGE